MNIEKLYSDIKYEHSILITTSKSLLIPQGTVNQIFSDSYQRPDAKPSMLLALECHNLKSPAQVLNCNAYTQAQTPNFLCWYHNI